MILIPMILMGVIGIGVGYMIGKQNRTEKRAQRELLRANTLINDLSYDAAEHSALGDHFAAITLDKIRTHRKELL